MTVPVGPFSALTAWNEKSGELKELFGSTRGACALLRGRVAGFKVQLLLTRR